MHTQWILSLPEGISVARQADGTAVLVGHGARLSLGPLTPALLAALKQLVFPGERCAGLLQGLDVATTADAPARLLYYLHLLARRGLLHIAVGDATQPLATLWPTSRTFTLAHVDPAERVYVLSRFAYLHRVGQELVLETPLCAARIVLHDPRVAALIHALSAPATLAQLETQAVAFPPDALAPLLSLLARSGFLTTLGTDGHTAEDEQPELRHWEFHDLLYHARSREGRHDTPCGNTYRLAGVCPLPPAIKPRMTAETVELARPDLGTLAARDPPLARVMEERRSLREYDDQPITAEQLGECLYRTVAVRAIHDYDAPTPDGPLRVQVTVRPYPSGGALYPIEVYPVVQTCLGLEAGLYHYDASQHRLSRLAALTPEVQELLTHAALATTIAPQDLQVLLVLTARFERVAWKYSGISYALILKDLGGVFQSLYLAATAMGLAPCAIGGGDADLFARAAGLNYYVEGSVGEFVLGSKKTPPP
jgi:SagB-type dehydrogenase family enzyme